MQLSFLENTTYGASLENLYNFKLIQEEQDVDEVLSTLSGKDKIAFDTETTSLDWRRGDIHGMSLATDRNEWYIMGQAFQKIIKPLSAMAKNPAITWFGHNLKFDLHFLLPYGFSPSTIFDTMVAQALIDENQELKLKVLSSVKLGMDGDFLEFGDLINMAKKLKGAKRKSLVTIWDIPIEILSAYAGKDARYTYDLAMLSINELVKEKMDTLFYKVEMPFLMVLFNMENTGFFVNQEMVKELDVEFTEKLNEYREEWDRLSGNVNPESAPQLQEYLYKTMKYPATLSTKKGAPSTDYLALTRLLKLDKNGAVTALVNFKKYNKLMNTYIDKIRRETVDGRIKSSFNQTGAVTWRLSSSDPINLQNIPGKGEDGAKVRAIFSASPGNKMVVLDYSQIELRLLAHYSKDENLMRVFKENGDPHQLTADLITSKGYSITRKQAKAVNFGWAYGMGPRGLANRIEEDTGDRPSESDTKVWLNGFAEAYPATIEWKERVLYFVRDHAFVVTVDGHKRRLPEIKSYNREVRSRAERQAVNTIIQGSAAAIIKTAMLSIHGWQEFYGAKMVAQVHDELIFEVPENAASEFLVAAKREMENVGKIYNLRVELLADGNVGDNWSDAKG